MSERRVVITGMGVISPVGNNKDDFWKNIQAVKGGLVVLLPVGSPIMPVKSPIRNNT